MTLVVHTARVSYGGPDRLDITAKSGVKAFAPSWKILGPFLAKRRLTMITDADWAQYEFLYSSEMLDSIDAHYETWAALLAREHVVLCCYCTESVQCHRFLLAEILVELGATYEGETTTPRKRAR